MISPLSCRVTHPSSRATRYPGSPSFSAEQPRVPITVTLPDSSTRPGTSFETTPFDVAASISKGLSEKVIIAKVDGKLWDLNRPLEKDCTLEVMDFDHPSGEAKAVFWHSSAHVLGEACEGHLEGCCLGHGPPIDDGFFYDMKLDNDRSVIGFIALVALSMLTENIRTPGVSSRPTGPTSRRSSREPSRRSRSSSESRCPRRHSSTCSR